MKRCRLTRQDASLLSTASGNERWRGASPGSPRCFRVAIPRCEPPLDVSRTRVQREELRMSMHICSAGTRTSSHSRSRCPTEPVAAAAMSLCIEGGCRHRRWPSCTCPAAAFVLICCCVIGIVMARTSCGHEFGYPRVHVRPHGDVAHRNMTGSSPRRRHGPVESWTCERAAGRVYVTMVQVAGPGWRVVFCVGLLCPPAASAQTESETRLERSVERDTSCDSAFSLEYVGQKASRIKQVK